MSSIRWIAYPKTNYIVHSYHSVLQLIDIRTLTVVRNFQAEQEEIEFVHSLYNQDELHFVAYCRMVGSHLLVKLTWNINEEKPIQRTIMSPDALPACLLPRRFTAVHNPYHETIDFYEDITTPGTVTYYGSVDFEGSDVEVYFNTVFDGRLLCVSTKGEGQLFDYPLFSQQEFEALNLLLLTTFSNVQVVCDLIRDYLCPAYFKHAPRKIETFIKIAKKGELLETDQAVQFHWAMQDPDLGVINFSTHLIDQSIEVGLLSKIKEYFTKYSGRYFLEQETGQRIQALCLDKMNLSSENAYRCIIDLIQSNPQIDRIELRHTQLPEVAGHAICEALIKNTHLSALDVSMNPQLSKETIGRIKDLMSLPPEKRSVSYSGTFELSSSASGHWGSSSSFFESASSSGSSSSLASEHLSSSFSF